ncbi:sensor histidine kinase [Faecalibacterium prausnitzii]|jgi:two-component system sensor histidine kinase AgrC|uniref:sensor histidine kinase n=1 Tax=Faecalibacterium prausnitzii TaxID=853 RepID=UPI001FA7D9AB|nr:sensor histidine kinase [Faecalibacterium prausnitzii]MCI3185265.1 ATP-binding protein [Faecalibacterium prausnitzii]MCI3203171.1 ATP-binding protein [Faecalibacterium prausnitzii]
MYYFIELAGSVTNIALLSLFMSRLFVRNKIQSKWHSAFLTLLCTGQCVLSLFPNWVIPRTLYLLLGGFLLARLFYEVQTWPAAFASGSFFVLGSVVEILAMLLIGVRLPDTDLLMQAGAVRVIYVVFSNLLQIPLLILVSHFFNREESDLRIVWLFPLISIQLASISVCYVVQCHAADKDFPDYMVFFIAVLLFVNIMIVFYVEALRKNEKEKYLAELTEQHYHLQIEYYQQLLEKQQETKALWHDIKKYTAAMQAVAAQNDSEQLRQIAQAAEDAYERVKDISAVGNPVVDALLNQYLRSAKENQIQVLLDITIPEVLAISTLLLSVVIGNTFDNAIEACRLINPEKREIHLQLRKQNRILFYSIENPYIDAVTQLRVGKHHGYGLKNVERAVNQNNGNFQLEKVDGNFIVQIRLNCEN